MYECDDCGYKFEEEFIGITDDDKHIMNGCPNCGCGQYEEIKIPGEKCQTCADFTEDWHVKHGCIGVDAKAKNYDGCDHYKKKSDKPEIDYRNLLKKYMNHVGEQEGIDFTGNVLLNSSGFSNFEADELNKISDETREEYEDRDQTNLFSNEVDK